MIHENELRGDIVFSETLRKLRKNKKLNQAQLAKELYISPRQYHNMRQDAQHQAVKHWTESQHISMLLPNTWWVHPRYMRLKKCWIRNTIRAPLYQRHWKRLCASEEKTGKHCSLLLTLWQFTAIAADICKSRTPGRGSLVEAALVYACMGREYSQGQKFWVGLIMRMGK